MQGFSRELLETLNEFAPEPDLWILFNTPLEVRLARAMNDTRWGETFLRSEDAFRREQVTFDELFQKFRKRTNVLIVDGTGRPEDIESEIWGRIKPIIACSGLTQEDGCLAH
jgi:thymidylate kinase